MKINWKLRLQNKMTLIAIVMAVIGLIYQVMGLVGIVPAISQDAVTQAAGTVINVLALMGIITDPTTEGLSDSQQALGYSEPKKGGNKEA